MQQGILPENFCLGQLLMLPFKGMQQNFWAVLQFWMFTLNTNIGALMGSTKNAISMIKCVRWRETWLARKTIGL